MHPELKPYIEVIESKLLDTSNVLNNVLMPTFESEENVGVLTGEHWAASLNIVQALRTGVVSFRFSRVTYDGAARDAIGTLYPQYINQVYTFVGGDDAPERPGLFRYWDLRKDDWRSFYIQNVSEWEQDFEVIDGDITGIYIA
jgi:hypothetical protein